MQTTTHGEPSSEPLFPTARAFIVQFSRDTDIGAGGEWQGRVEHVVSGRSSRFSTASDLFAFMRDVVSDAGADGEKGS